MSSRGRLILIFAVTIAAAAGAVAYSVSRFVEWHRAGWTGVFYSPSFPPSKGRIRTSSQNPGEVMMTYSNTPADGVFKAHDRVISVNGIAVGDIPRLRALDPTFHRGDRIIYRVRRGRKLLDLPLRLDSPFRSPFMLMRIGVAFVVAATFLVVALLVVARRPDDRRALVFYIFALISALAMIGGAATVYEQAGGRGIVANFGFNAVSSILVLLCSFAYAPLVLHLSLIFPHD